MKNLLSKAAKLFVAALMIFTLAPTKIVAEGTNGSAIAVSGTTATATLSLFSDKDNKHPIDKVSRTSDVYGNLVINFNKPDYKPTDTRLSYTYTFPADTNVKIDDQDTISSASPRTLQDENGNAAGTWYFSNNILTFTYDKAWVEAHPDNIKAMFRFSFKMTNNTSKNDTSKTYQFPGVVDTTTIPYDNGNVNGNKEVDSVNADGTISFKITVTPDKDCDLVLTDTLGSNLSFIEDSFLLDGSKIITPTIKENVAVLNISTLTVGKHEITYKTKINDLNNESAEGTKNTASWTWDSKGKSEPQTSNPSITYNHLTKKGTINDGKVNWTVTLNDGNVLADMRNYEFKDSLDTKDNQKYTGNYTVTGEDGKVYANNPLDADNTYFVYKFGNDVPKQKYTIEYQTQITDTNVLAIEKNTASGTPTGGNTHTSSAEVGNYITKNIVDESAKSTTGIVKWKSIAKLQGAGDTFKDTLKFDGNDWSEEIWFTDGASFHPIVMGSDANGNSVELVEGIDYSLQLTQQNKLGNSRVFIITFKDTDNITSTINHNNGAYSVEYTSTCLRTPGEYSNYAEISHNYVTKGDSKKYTIPSVASAINKDGNLKWDDNKKAWIIEWTITANVDMQKNQAINSLNGQVVTIKDTLPEGLTFVKDKSTYSCYLQNWAPSCIYDKAIEPDIDGQTITFNIDTSKVSSTDKVKIAVKFTTEVSILPGEKKTFTNSATGITGDGSVDFGKATKSVTVDNQVLSKSSKQSEDTKNLVYTIKVNEHNLDLVPNSDTVTVVDDMDAQTSFVSGSLKVTDKNGTDITSECPQNFSGDNHMEITVPDSQYCTIEYSTRLSGDKNQWINVSNKASINGSSTMQTTVPTWVQVLEAAGTTIGNSGSITIYKSDANDSSKKLDGAVFELYEINNINQLNSNNTEASFNAVLRDKKESKNGTVVFKDASLDKDSDTNLKLNTLYYFKEAKAPVGYEINNQAYTYFILKDASDEETYNKIYNLATQILAKSETKQKVNTVLNYNVYDTKKTTATLSVNKTVDGADAPAETFNFTLGAVTEKAPLPDNTTASCADKGTATFGTINYGVADAGKTYIYSITETAGSTLGMSYSKATQYAKVVVSDDVKSATVTYGTSAEDIKSTEAPTITNTYVKPSTTATLSVNKTVDGADAPAETFNFTLGAVTEKAPLPDNTTASCADKGTATFGTINYGVADAGKTYIYSITETAGSTLGMSYSKATQYAKVVVSDDVKSATVTYGTSAEDIKSTEAPTITNTYVKQVGNLVISKSFDGDNITDEDKANLKFEVTYPDGTVKTIAYSEFTDGKYTLENVPNGDYKVREVNPEIKGYDVTVTTTVDGKTSDTAAVATKATSTIEIKDSYTKRPTTPITPDTPTPTPSTPTTPERPTTPTTTDRPHTPNTGDQTNAGMAAGAFGFSMLIAGFAIFFKKKYSA